MLAHGVSVPQLSGVSAVAALPLAHELEEEEPFLGDGDLQAGGLTDDDALGDPVLILEDGPGDLGAVSSGLLLGDQHEAHLTGPAVVEHAEKGRGHGGHGSLGIV